MSRDQKKGIGKRSVKSRRKQHIEINIAKADKVRLFILNIVLAKKYFLAIYVYEWKKMISMIFATLLTSLSFSRVLAYRK